MAAAAATSGGLLNLAPSRAPTSSPSFALFGNSDTRHSRRQPRLCPRRASSVEAGEASYTEPEEALLEALVGVQGRGRAVAPRQLQEVESAVQTLEALEGVPDPTIIRARPFVRGIALEWLRHPKQAFANTDAVLLRPSERTTLQGAWRSGILKRGHFLFLQFGLPLHTAHPAIFLHQEGLTVWFVQHMLELLAQISSGERDDCWSGLNEMVYPLLVL